MRKTFLFGFMLILFAGLVLAVPGVPHQFDGAVTINGAPAPDGSKVTATVDGVTRGSGSTVGGMYGDDQPFEVLDPDNLYGTYHPEIRFYVDGYDTGESVAFVAGEYTTLDLSITKSSSSSSSSSGGGGGGGGGGSLLFGTDLWDCDEWSECVHGEQFQTCYQGDSVKVNTRDCEDDTSGLASSAPPSPPGMGEGAGDEDLLASPGAPPITGSAVTDSDKSFVDMITGNWMVPFLAGIVIVLLVLVLVLSGRKKRRQKSAPVSPEPLKPEQPSDSLEEPSFYRPEPSQPITPRHDALPSHESGLYELPDFDELPDFKSRHQSDEAEQDFF